MSGRQTLGRQRIPIRLIESQDDMYATFSKRRQGLYKKANELCTLCGVDIGIIIFSPTDIPYSFFSPTMESVMDRYRNPNVPQSEHSRMFEAISRARIQQCNMRLDSILDEKEGLKEREKVLDEIDRTREKGWWEQPIESLNKEQVKHWISWWSSLQEKIKRRMEELSNGAGSSSNLAHGLGGGMIVRDQFPGQFYGAPRLQYGSIPGGNMQFYGAPGTHESDPTCGSSFGEQIDGSWFDFFDWGSSFQYYLPISGENELETGSSRTGDNGVFPH